MRKGLRGGVDIVTMSQKWLATGFGNAVFATFYYLHAGSTGIAHARLGGGARDTIATVVRGWGDGRDGVSAAQHGERAGEKREELFRRHVL